MPTPKRRPFQVWSEGTLAALLVAPPLLFAGAFAWTVPIILGLAVLGALIALSRDGADPARSAQHPFVLLCALGAAIPAVQLLPVPAEWLAQSPRHSLAIATWRLLGESPTWVPMSLDPGSTRQAVMTAAAVLSVALAAGSLPRRQRMPSVAAAALLSISVAVGVHYLHALVGADQVYGLHSPTYTNALLAGPILNPNHRGAVASFGATLSLAFALRVERPAPPMVLAAFLAFAAIHTGSRGVLASFGVSFLAFLLWSALRGPRERRAKSRAGLLACCLVAPASLWLAWPRLAAEGFEKLRVAAASFAFFLDHPVLGIGRGAFSVVQALEGNDLVRYTHPENIVAQWVTEGGVLGLVVVLGSGGYILRSLWRVTRSFEALVIAALLGLGAHELVDFSMEMPGLVVVAASVAATLPRGSFPRQGGNRRFLRVIAWGFVGASGLALVFGASRPYDRAAGPAAAAQARPLLEAHPLEPELLLLEARRLAMERGPETARWLNHAARTAPGWASPRVLAARWLTALGRRDQAWLELAEAAKRVPTSAALPACQIVQSPAVAIEETFGLLERVIPSEARAETLRSLRTCLVPDHRLAVDRWAARSGVPGAAARLAASLIARNETDAAERWLAKAPDDAETKRLWARLALRVGDATSALAALPGDGQTTTLELRARALLALGRSEEARAVLRTLRARSSESTSARRRFLRFERGLKRAHQEAREGRGGSSIADVPPTRPRVDETDPLGAPPEGPNP